MDYDELKISNKNENKIHSCFKSQGVVEGESLELQNFKSPDKKRFFASFPISVHKMAKEVDPQMNDENYPIVSLASLLLMVFIGFKLFHSAYSSIAPDTSFLSIVTVSVLILCFLFYLHVSMVVTFYDVVKSNREEKLRREKKKILEGNK